MKHDSIEKSAKRIICADQSQAEHSIAIMYLPGGAVNADVVGRVIEGGVMVSLSNDQMHAIVEWFLEHEGARIALEGRQGNV